MGGDLDEAHAPLERAIAIDEEQFQPIKYEIGYDAEVLERIYVELGLLDEAEIRLDQSDHVFRELGLLRAGHRAWLLLVRGEVERAREYFEETLAREDTGEWFQTTVFDCRRGLAEVARARGDREGAQEELARAIAVGEGMWPGGHPRLREVRELYDSL